MFEPVHGSAPDIVGLGIANPLGQLWSGAMMLDHLGHPTAAAHLMAAIEATLTEGTILTPDLGGDAKTAQVTDTVLAHIEAPRGPG
jgi:tartrate dehydrogenase/decarboxylase/D-malate dehydrogenase